jgi:mono/diheme cytochrome c family protein
VAPTSKSRRLAWALLPLLALIPACQQKMAVQPSYRPDQPGPFFADGREARPRPAGVVARGHLRTDLALFTGRRDRLGRDWETPAILVATAGQHPLAAATLVEAVGRYGDAVDTFPFPVTREVLEHGRNRFMIYCVVCHDALGTGKGKIVERGYTTPPSYHIPRLREAPVGHFFQVITLGYGSMPDYGEQIPPRDRWAIVAYIRALQLSQHFPRDQLTEAMRREMRDQPPTPEPGGQP